MGEKWETIFAAICNDPRSFANFRYGARERLQVNPLIRW
jgi:hypothetical protein